MMTVYVACFDCREGIVVPNNGTACVTRSEAEAFTPDRIEEHVVPDEDFAEVFPGRSDGTRAPDAPPEEPPPSP